MSKSIRGGGILVLFSLSIVLDFVALGPKIIHIELSKTHYPILYSVSIISNSYVFISHKHTFSFMVIG